MKEKTSLIISSKTVLDRLIKDYSSHNDIWVWTHIPHSDTYEIELNGLLICLISKINGEKRYHINRDYLNQEDIVH